MGVKKPGLLLMCHGDFPWNFFSDTYNRKLYDDCFSAMIRAYEGARSWKDDEFTHLSDQIASTVDKQLDLNGIELSYLSCRRPAVKQAIAQTTAKGSRNIICAGAAGLMAPAHSTSEHLPGEIKRVIWDNPALDIVYAEPCIKVEDAALLTQRSIEYAFGDRWAVPGTAVDGRVEEDTGVVLVSAHGYDIDTESSHAAEFMRAAAMLSSRSGRWHDAGIGSEAAEFMSGISSKFQSQEFVAVEAGFIDFSSPGIEEAALRLMDRGAGYILAAGMPALLHRHPMSVVSPSMAVEWLQATFPYVDIVYVKPDPAPIADLLGARIASNILDAQRKGERIKPDYKKAPTF